MEVTGPERVRTRAWLSRFDARRMGDSIVTPATLIALLAVWRRETPLEPGDDCPEIDDMPARSEDVF